jgi:ketosteroid isomerase-like protein
MGEAVRAVIDDIIDAFRCGDHARLADRYDDDLDWLLHAPVAMLPSAGVRRGKNAVLAGLLGLYRDFRIFSYKVPLIMVEGDRAAMISDLELMERASGRVIASHVASFQRFRGGKMIEYRGFSGHFGAADGSFDDELDVWSAGSPPTSPWLPKVQRG